MTGFRFFLLVAIVFWMMAGCSSGDGDKDSGQVTGLDTTGEETAGGDTIPAGDLQTDKDARPADAELMDLLQADQVGLETMSEDSRQPELDTISQEDTPQAPDEVEPTDIPDICVPDCAGRVCGDDGCGVSCGVCGEGLFCNGDGACEEVRCFTWDDLNGDYSCTDICNFIHGCGHTCDNCSIDCEMVSSNSSGFEPCFSSQDASCWMAAAAQNDCTAIDTCYQLCW